MARNLLQRFLLTLPAHWLVLTLVFLMIHIVPGDPVEQMLGEGAPRPEKSPSYATPWFSRVDRLRRYRHTGWSACRDRRGHTADRAVGGVWSFRMIGDSR